MLRELHVKNLALLESVSVSFAQGLIVVTGETGAGKSLVVDSLLLLSGVRATSDLIRTGADTLSVTGLFDSPSQRHLAALLDEHGVETADEIVIRREVSREGRNRVFINDTPVTLKLLTRLAPLLIRIHTQREELEIVAPETQRSWVDASGGADLQRAAAATREACNRFRGLDDRWQALVADERSRLERIDLLQFQVQEIEAAGIEPGEEEALRERRGILRHRDRVREALGLTVQGLYEADGAAGERIAVAVHALEEVSEWVPEADAWGQELEDARLRVEEVARAAAVQLEGVDEDPKELDRVEQRLAELERLFRKYGEASDRVLDVCRGAKAELETLLGDVENRDQLEKDRRRALDEYRTAAERLSAERVRAGELLAAAVQEELAELAMQGARLSVDVQPTGDPDGEPDDERLFVTPHGWDRVTLMLAANPGEPAGPLARVASGGELSRIYLALQLVARADKQAEQVTLVFDEVDSGVSGAAAEALGTKLRRLAQGGQLLVVTHLPQVASCGHEHLRVEKTSDERTTVRVHTLSAGGRVEEVARMLAGREVTEVSRSHAADLLRQASA